MQKFSPMMIALTIIVVLVAIYGGYRVIHHLNRIKAQSSVQQTVTPTAAVSPSANTSPEATVPNEMTVNLVEENKSGESGIATLKEDNGKTTVTLALTGFVKDVAQPAHIHIGVCPGVDAVKYPLTNVVNGSSVTILDVTLDQLKKISSLAINVHKSAKDISNYTSCGEFSLE